jgi:hypothetical protein
VADPVGAECPIVTLTSDGWAPGELEVADADIDEVLAWAQGVASGRCYTISAAAKVEGAVGTVRIFGGDPANVP